MRAICGRCRARAARATQLTTGVGIESQPIFSPDGRTIAFTGEYDGNTDVFTIPATGGIPKRITYHPAADVAVGWTPDGKSILFRSNRDAASRYTQIFEISADGGVEKRLPLPTAYEGALSPDGSRIAYNPLGPGSAFNFTTYVSWGNYHGGLAPALWITTLPGLESVEVPHETSADYSPTWADGKLYFLSGRKGRSRSTATTRRARRSPRCITTPGRTFTRSRATDTRWSSTGWASCTRWSRAGSHILWTWT